jgi:hypothetical protein
VDRVLGATSELLVIALGFAVDPRCSSAWWARRCGSRRAGVVERCWPEPRRHAPACRGPTRGKDREVQGFTCITTVFRNSVHGVWGISRKLGGVLAKAPERAGSPAMGRTGPSCLRVLLFLRGPPSGAGPAATLAAAPALGRLTAGPVWLPPAFSLSTENSKLASEPTCEFNINYCRSSKIVKPFL